MWNIELPSAQVLGRPSGHGFSPCTLCGSEPSAQVGLEPSSHLPELYWAFSTDKYYTVFLQPLAPIGNSGFLGMDGSLPSAQVLGNPSGQGGWPFWGFWGSEPSSQVGLVPSSHLGAFWRLRPTRQPSRIREARMLTGFLLLLTSHQLLAAFYIRVTSSTVNFVLILLLTGPKLFRIELTNSLP